MMIVNINEDLLYDTIEFLCSYSFSYFFGVIFVFFVPTELRSTKILKILKKIESNWSLLS